MREDFAKQVRHNNRLILLGSKDDAKPTRVSQVSSKDLVVRKQRHRIGRVGSKCAKVNTHWLPAARTMIDQGFIALKVLSSERVPNKVLRVRDSKCSDCEHATEMYSDLEVLYFCQCCGCGAWSGMQTGSDCHSKNKHAANVCPEDPPRFEEYKGKTLGKMFGRGKVIVIMALALWHLIREKTGNGNKQIHR